MPGILRPGSRLRALLTVSALAAAAGATLGFGVAAGLLTYQALVRDPFSLRDTLGVLGIGALFGVACGLALGPLTAFGLLRAVPLWRSIVWTGAGALLGLASSAALLQLWSIFVSPLFTVPVGFLGGAVLARVRQRRLAPAGPPRALAEDSAGDE